MKIQPYLSFNGNCMEAFSFYKKLFSGQLQNKETWENKSVDIPGSYRDKIQHVELKASGVFFMGYDVAPDTPLNKGNTTCMSIDLDSREEADDLFSSLSKGGTTHENMQESSWGGYYGRCTDQYDITWMINAK
ncbi:VOC family protein [Nonlabens antarcticus]|uniref:VOC family protein n=1 Tax=Nonlabens antarcticus TaxID=392714 RepID=UPI001890BCCA|nr:VOC family protein [Nonlabens antarcticus]